ncbi:hypothetical protein LLG90_14505 [Aromatoleum toluclasticum]|nr:hypothetical protein [Aromatoleum toluclasticum]
MKFFRRLLVIVSSFIVGLHGIAEGHDKAGIVFEDKPGRERHIVRDAADPAPRGFAVRVGATKTSIPRRKVNGKFVQPSVGNVAGLPDLAAARAKAAKFVGKLRRSDVV